MVPSECQAVWIQIRPGCLKRLLAGKMLQLTLKGKCIFFVFVGFMTTENDVYFIFFCRKPVIFQEN